jgi:hypothetical protein
LGALVSHGFRPDLALPHQTVFCPALSPHLSGYDDFVIQQIETPKDDSKPKNGWRLSRVATHRFAPKVPGTPFNSQLLYFKKA